VGERLSVMGKKPSRGRARERGKSNGNVAWTIGHCSSSSIPVADPSVDQDVFADAADTCGLNSNQDLGDPGAGPSILPDEFEEGKDNEDDGIDDEIGNQEVDFECISMGSEEESVLLEGLGDSSGGDCVKNSDWRGLFISGRSLGNLQYFVPSKNDGKVYVSHPEEAIEEGIEK
jgi:hypothetical protein